MKKGWFLGHLRLNLKKLLMFGRKNINYWSMVSFVHSGSEITTRMGYNFKTKSKSTKFQALFLRKTSFLNFKLQIIRLAQRHWRCTPTHKISYFYSYTCKKTFGSSFYQRLFFCQSVGRKVMNLVSKYLLPAWWRYKRGFLFFLT